MMIILAALLLFPLVLGANQICPDGGGCSDTDTCCRVLGGHYGCCPLTDATCCDDEKSCCPANEVCGFGYCWGVTEGGNRSITTKGIPLILVKGNDVVCPDGEATCPDDTTCCRSPPGQSPEYGCCPMTDAVCCEDGVHCCPTGTTCDVAEGKCQGDGYVTEMYRKKPHGLARIRSSRSGAVCNGTSVQCTDSNTCCMTRSGEYGCCPFANAHCCEDRVHCCPGNMHCDATSQYCSSNGTIKAPAQNILIEVVPGGICPDKTTCGSLDTCCGVGDGKFGCCPYPNAACCSDGLHCCPSGTRCDAQSSRCVDESWISVDMNEIAQS